MTIHASLLADSAEIKDIKNHLIECSDQFIPPLITRLDIDEYACKIAKHANTYEAWSSGVLIGLVATYENYNEEDGYTSFITNVSIGIEWQGRGLAKKLLCMCFSKLKKVGCREIVLSVDLNNTRALALYKNLGFNLCSKINNNVNKDSNNILLRKNL